MAPPIRPPPPSAFPRPSFFRQFFRLLSGPSPPYPCWFHPARPPEAFQPHPPRATREEVREGGQGWCTIVFAACGEGQEKRSGISRTPAGGLAALLPLPLLSRLSPSRKK